MSPTLRSTVVAFAAIFAMGALFFAWMFWDSGRDAELRAAERAELSAFPNAADGERCYLEGTLLPGTPLAMGFLAFERYTQRARRRVVLAREYQVLTIESAQGVVAFANSDYAFDHDHGGWWHEEKIEHAPTFSESAITVQGLLPGRSVVAFGVAEGTAVPRRFRAAVVSAGSMEGYRAELASQIAWGGWPVYGLVALAAACLLLAFQQGRRLMREP